MARLIDDEDALAWLAFEIDGYLPEEGNKLGAAAWAAATRSHRVTRDEKDGSLRATTTTVGQLEANIEAARQQIAASVDPAISVSSANPHQFVNAPTGNAMERVGAATRLSNARASLDRVIGSVHAYASATYQSLRFGAAVETAFELVRREVDLSIGYVIPDALPKLNAALENLASENPEHWAQAAASCRRLIKSTADALRPPGEDVGGRKMGDPQYINRLADWIQTQSTSDTTTDAVTADLEYLGRRLDAYDDAGHKGAHTEVLREDAARFVTGTYLLLGDILKLRQQSDTLPGTAVITEGEESASAEASLGVAPGDSREATDRSRIGPRSGTS